MCYICSVPIEIKFDNEVSIDTDSLLAEDKDYQIWLDQKIKEDMEFFEKNPPPIE